MVPETHLRNLMTLCDADQRKARAPEIVMPRSDSDSELTRAHTHESADRDSWIEDAGFHPPNRLFLSFDVWLDPTVCPQLPEPSGVRKELEQLYIFQEKDARRQERQHRRARRVNPRPSVEPTSRALISEREHHDEKRPPGTRKRGLLSRILRGCLCQGP